VYLENLVIDAVEPQRLGRFWEAVVGAERLIDEPDAFETRLTVEGGPVLDLCFQRVWEPLIDPPRLHLDLSGGARQPEEVDRLLGLMERLTRRKRTLQRNTIGNQGHSRALSWSARSAGGKCRAPRRPVGHKSQAMPAAGR
jgi:hypothetical protein